MRLPRLLGLLMLAVCAAHAAAADPDPGDAARAGWRALLEYYQGHWQCRGHFANGTPIASEEEFEPWLNATWLHERHDDELPFSYHAHSVWGLAKAGQALTLTIYDNSGGVRVFTSGDWLGAAITFDAQSGGEAPGRRERFVYRREPPAAFSFEYQVAAPDGAWRMGDHVECSKR